MGFFFFLLAQFWLLGSVDFYKRTFTVNVASMNWKENKYYHINIIHDRKKVMFAAAAHWCPSEGATYWSHHTDAFCTILKNVSHWK